MKKAIAMMSLAMAGTSFGVDEYLPIEAGKLEVDVAYGLKSATGSYNEDGDKQDMPDGSSAMEHLIPLQLKYGIIPGLDVEVVWAFKMNEKEQPDVSASGLDQPEIALKYALMDVGAGAYVNFIAPFATGDWADPDSPPMALALGAVYTKLFVPQFNLTAMAQYRLNFEGENKIKAGNVLTVYAKPEFRFNEFGGAYLGLKYDMNGESELDGTSRKDDGYLITLLPGWNATWLPNVSTEVNVPYTIMGNNTAASWGINASVYVTVGL